MDRDFGHTRYKELVRDSRGRFLSFDLVSNKIDEIIQEHEARYSA